MGNEPRKACATEGCILMTIDAIRAMAKQRGCPGPDVVEHDEEYDGECYCQLCLSYAD